MIAYMLVNASQGLYLFPATSFPVSLQLAVRTNSCSSGSNGTLEIRLLHSHAKQALTVMLIIVWHFVYLRKILFL